MVDYVGPKISPDKKTAYVIRAVSQFSTKMYFYTSMSNQGWHAGGYWIWTKLFFCRSNADGQNPVVISELTPEKFGWEEDKFQSGDPVAFDVSWTQQKAAALVNRSHNNVLLVDLQTGTCESQTISKQNAHGSTGFRDASFEIVNDGSQVLWSMDYTTAGIMDFQGHGQQTNVSDETGRTFYPAPMWNEEQKEAVLLVSPRSLRSSELWVFTPSFDLIEKVDATPILELWRHNIWKHQKTEDKYAWVIERRFNPSKPKPIEFALKNHTLELKRIDPKDAAATW